MTKPSVSEVKELFEPLSQVPDNEVQYLLDHSVYEILREDEYMFEQGKSSDEMRLICSGRIRVFNVQQNQSREIAILEKGDITGLLPYSRLKIASGYGQALEDAKILSLHRKDLPDLIRENYQLTEALVHFMSSRIREFTTFQQQSEKMMALGKLSAGLAHELNNPASAIVRSSKELKSHLGQLPENFKNMIRIRVEEEKIDAINEILFNRLKQKAPKRMSLMERQVYEDELVDCLEELGADNADEIADNLIEFGFTCEEIEKIEEYSGSKDFPSIIKWISDNLTTEKMVGDIEEASGRIAKLVGSVKNFTHMDRGNDKTYADLHEGIDNTLVMLNHKLKEGNIHITKNFSEELPKANIFVSELNQVWTNLIDNAIDALEGVKKPEIIIETREEKGFIKIAISDNGPGIPEDIKTKIFDPFFTTKEMGKGTGLGLDVVKNIVSRHNGTVKVDSRSGKTEFEVCIPLG